MSINYLLLFFGLLLLEPAFCQKAKFIGEDGNLTRFIGKNMESIPFAEGSPMRKSDPRLFHYVTVKFTVTTSGSIDSIHVLNSNSDVIAQQLKKVLLQTEGEWEPAKRKGKYVESKPIILPFMVLLSGPPGGYKAEQEAEQYKATKAYLKDVPECKRKRDCTILPPMTMIKYSTMR